MVQLPLSDAVHLRFEPVHPEHDPEDHESADETKGIFQGARPVDIRDKGRIACFNEVREQAEAEDQGPEGIENEPDHAGGPALFIFHEIDELERRGDAEPADPGQAGRETEIQALTGLDIHDCREQRVAGGEEGECRHGPYDGAVAGVMPEENDPEDDLKCGNDE